MQNIPLNKRYKKQVWAISFFGFFAIASVFISSPDVNASLAYVSPYFKGLGDFSVFGFSPLGESVASLLVWGFWQTIFIAFSGRFLAIVLVFVGSAAASVGGKSAHFVITRICEAFMTLPSLLIALSLGFILGEGAYVMILVIGISEWAFNQKWMLGRLHEYERHDYIMASRLLGAGPLHLFFRQHFPLMRADLGVLFFLYLPGSLLTVAALEFLGLSTGAGIPGLGYQVALNKDVVFLYPHTILPSGVLIVLTVFVTNHMRNKSA
ncbi:MAG: ABC transporter permease subunit [Leptospirales bacterium]